MKLESQSFADGAPIPGEFAFCIPHSTHRVCLGRNLNPHLAWSEAPAGTRSFAIICHDPDVPSRGEDVNREGHSVPADLPRVDFFHWALVDIPTSITSIQAGEFSHEVTPQGKPGPMAAHGTRQGINDFTDDFGGDQDMRGDYYGYDGPCPPWNDTLRHHYVFTLFALDLARLPLEGRFTGQQVRNAMAGHILAQACFTGTYSLNAKIIN